MAELKKVCIVTISGGSNFGNRLQNYAMQEVLGKIGMDAEALKNWGGEILAKYLKHPLFSYLLRSKCAEIVFGSIVKKGRWLKKVKFAQFNNEYINWSSCCAIDKKISSGDDLMQYDAFLAGSDQVWNPEMKFNSDIEYLAFAKEQIRIAYAASFGVSELSPQQMELSRRELPYTISFH